jgi:hypothetical protein
MSTFVRRHECGVILFAIPADASHAGSDFAQVDGHRSRALDESFRALVGKTHPSSRPGYCSATSLIRWSRRTSANSGARAWTFA